MDLAVDASGLRWTHDRPGLANVVMEAIPMAYDTDVDPGVLVIIDLPSLYRFSGSALKLLGRGDFEQIRVAVPSLDRREHVERIMNRHYRACGCVEGGVAVMLALLIVLWWDIVVDRATSLTTKDIAAQVGAVFLAALVGKALGVMRSHLILRRAVSRIECAVRVQSERGELR